MAHEPRLGSTLGDLRQKAGVSLRTVAAATGLDDSVLSKIENGGVKQPTQDTLRRLADYYDVEVEELYTMAGYEIAGDLPSFAPYLRSKYKLEAEAIEELRNHFDYIRTKYDN